LYRPLTSGISERIHHEKQCDKHFVKTSNNQPKKLPNPIRCF
jgi:hypothetical protein